jgi:hypothetical protein
MNLARNYFSAEFAEFAELGTLRRGTLRAPPYRGAAQSSRSPGGKLCGTCPAWRAAQ